MTKTIPATLGILLAGLVLVLVPLFAFACTRGGAAPDPAFNNLSTAFSRFNR